MRDSRCKNCGTERHSIIARGLCKRCYRIVRRIEQIQSWNSDDEGTLRGFPRIPILPGDHIPRMKADVLLQLKESLEKLRLKEHQFREPIDSMTLEGMLGSLARKAGAKSRGLMHGTAICFDSFTPEQRRTLFELFNSIEEDIPQRDCIDWSRYMRRVTSE